MDKLTVKPQDVRDAIDSDLDRLGMSEAEFGAKLGITQQAINKWRRMGVVPFRKFDSVVAVLGADSAFAKIGVDGLFAAKENRHQIITQAMSSGEISSEQATEIIYKGNPEPGAVVRDLRRARGSITNFKTQMYSLANHVERPSLAEQNRELGMELQARLPEPLWPHLNNRGRYDYISPKLVLETRAHSGDGPAINSGAVLKIAAAKARGLAQHAVVAFVGAKVRVPDALAEDAKVLGVELWTVPDGAALAARITALEGVNSGTEVEDGDETYD